MAAESAQLSSALFVAVVVEVDIRLHDAWRCTIGVSGRVGALGARDGGFALSSHCAKRIFRVMPSLLRLADGMAASCLRQSSQCPLAFGGGSLRESDDSSLRPDPISMLCLTSSVGV